MEFSTSIAACDASLIINQFLSEASQDNQKPDERTLTARLCGESLELFRELLKISTNARNSTPDSDYVSLQRSFERLKLWSDGYGVAAGRLDQVFSKSHMLRTATLKLLGSLATTLTDRLTPQLTHSSWPAREPLKTVFLEVKLLAERTGVDDDDGASSSDVSYDLESDSMEEIAQDLLTDTLCLMELDPLLKNPILDERDDEERAAAHHERTDWGPHHVYCERIQSRFPQAASPLILRLGKANLERYIRCQEERCNEPNSITGVEDALLILRHADSVGSKFYDSALGSSVPPASSYAETIMSYRGKEGRSVRVPPLPPEGKTGHPFSCVACGRSVRISNNSAWKQHLYADLCPWLCLDPSCSRGDKVYKSKTDWISHLALDHRLEPAWESMECPLCLQSTGVGKTIIAKHLSSHLEEISLGALPSGLEFDTESEDEGQDAEDYQSNTPWKLDVDPDSTNMPSDLNTSMSKEAEVQQQEPEPNYDRIIKCICNHVEDRGNKIYCDSCETFQHVVCYYPDRMDECRKMGFQHICLDCEDNLKRCSVIPTKGEKNLARDSTNSPPNACFNNDKLESSEQIEILGRDPYQRIRVEHHDGLAGKSAVNNETFSTEAQTGFGEAREFVSRMKAHSPNIFKSYLEILQDFDSQRIDMLGVIDRARELFRGHADLLKGFAVFVPSEWANYIVTGNVEDIPSITTTPGASSSDQQKQATP
ncbi:hypothetical protein EV127DRAFT_442655 [Xylaria flabelliformis]|nr:hypothetical protein EV127DRAFT_442655 [Xylaria flabelliformis]